MASVFNEGMGMQHGGMMIPKDRTELFAGTVFSEPHIHQISHMQSLYLKIEHL